MAGSVYIEYLLPVTWETVLLVQLMQKLQIKAVCSYDPLSWKIALVLQDIFPFV
jgi:hypothetical protein